MTLKEISNAAADFIKAKEYNKHLYFHFIVSNFKQNDELTQYAVETFMEKEKDNSLSFYLAAIYYYKQNNFEKAKTAFLAANDLKNFDLFETELRDLINKIIIQKTNDPTLPAMMWVGIGHVELHMSLQRDIGGLIQRQEKLNVAMYRTLGEKFYNASSTVMGKMIGIGFRQRGFGKESLEYKTLNIEWKSLLKDHPNSQLKKLDILKEYMLDMIKVGEVQANKNLLTKEVTENLSKRASQLK